MSANYWKCPHAEAADRCRRCDAADVAALVAWLAPAVAQHRQRDLRPLPSV